MTWINVVVFYFRRFVQSSLRDFGFGKVRKGEMLKEEAKMLVEAVELAASGMDGGKGVVRAQVRMMENKFLSVNKRRCERPPQQRDPRGCLCCGRPLTADFVQDLLADAVVNVLWRMVAGERLEYGDPKLAELVTRVREVSRSTFPMPR